MYEIKVVTEADRKWAIDVAAKAMIKKEANRADLYNPQQLHLVFNKILADGTALIAWKDGKRIGCVAGVLTPHFLDPRKKILFEAVWYVDPEHRKTRATYMLMKQYAELCMSVADEGIFTILGHTEIKDESLAKLGWHLQEKHYNLRK